MPKGSSALANKIVKSAGTVNNISKNTKRAPTGQKGPDCLFRFLIPENIGGRVIGKGGEMVDRLKMKHNVLLKSPNSSSEDRVAYIYGHENEDNQNAVVGAIAELLSFLGDVLKKKSIHYGRQLKRFNTRLGQSRNDITEINALVDTSLIENLLKDGKFDSIWKESGAQVRAYIECCPNSTDRVINISGTIEEILNCSKLLIKHFPPGVIGDKSQIKYMGKYDPNFRNGIHSYGGFIEKYGGVEKQIMHGIDYQGTPSYVRGEDRSNDLMGGGPGGYNRASTGGYHTPTTNGYRPKENATDQYVHNDYQNYSQNYVENYQSEQSYEAPPAKQNRKQQAPGGLFFS